MVRIRLTRRGRKKLALFDVVIADQRAPRDGRFIEKIGTYNPNTDPATIDLDEERAFYWLMVGAQPSDTVRAMLSYRGILFRKHLQIGVNKGAITQEEADQKLAEWKEVKEAKIANKVDSIRAKQDAEAKARFEAETKVKEARAEVLKKRKEEEEAAKAEAEKAKQEEAAAKEQAQKEAAEQMKENQAGGDQEKTEG